MANAAITTSGSESARVRRGPMRDTPSSTANATAHTPSAHQVSTKNNVTE